MMASEEAEPDDAPITPGSRRHRPRRIAAAEEDSDGEGAATPAADEVAAEFMRLATTCSSDGTPTGPWHGGGDGASRPWHGGGDLVGGAEAEAGTEPDPAQIEVHELKIAPQPQHVRACLRAGRRGGASANETARCLGRSRARATPAGLRRAWLHVPAVGQAQAGFPYTSARLRAPTTRASRPQRPVSRHAHLRHPSRCKLGWRDFVAPDGRSSDERGVKTVSLRQLLTMLPCYYATMLPRYHATMLPCDYYA